MRRHGLIVVLAVWLSALTAFGAIGCSSSDNTSNDNPNYGGMRGRDGTGTGGGMMGGSGSRTDTGTP